MKSTKPVQNDITRESEEIKQLVTKFRSLNIQITPQRLVIASALTGSNKHLSVEDIHQVVRKKNPKIGLATVYRTLNLLKGKGLIEEHRFNDEFSRYELHTEAHHDHLICIECEAVIEFDQPVIEHLQDLAAAEKNFTIVSHRLQIYGICEQCEKAKKDQKREKKSPPS
jgi:Fur family ferric uptake transcriptional regulator